MKVVIAGGRDFIPQPEDALLLAQLDKKYCFTEIVCGEASGADTFGANYGKMMGIPVKSFPAAWDDLESLPCITKYNKFGKPYNALAGHNRNKQMAEYGNAIILFKGGAGTANMRKLAKKYKLKSLYDASYIDPMISWRKK